MIVKGVGGYFSGKEFTATDSLVFGRNSQSCNVLFGKEVEGISRVHCRIDVGQNGGATITDLGSSYGTFLNGNKLMANVPQNIINGDTFYLADKKNMFTVTGIEAIKEEIVAVDIDSMNEKEIIQTALSKKSIKFGVIAAAAVLLLLIVIAFKQSSNLSRQKEEIAEQEQELSEQQAQLADQQRELEQKRQELEAQKQNSQQQQQELNQIQQEIDSKQQQLNQQQQTIDNFNNRSPLEKIMDGVGGAFELFN